MTLLLLSLLLVICTVYATEEQRTIMEPKITKFSSDRWTKTDAVISNKIISATFVMKTDNDALNEFESNLLALSTPSSPTYAQWLKPNEVKERLSPSLTKVKVVTEWIESFGVKSRVSKYHNLIHVEMSISTASKMLATEFAEFTQKEIVIARITKPYSLPAKIAECVLLVDDILRFPSTRMSPSSTTESLNSLRSAKSTSSQPLKVDDAFSSCGSRCNGDTTPDVLSKAYSFPYLTKSTKGNSISVAEFQFEYFDDDDLKDFSNMCGVNVSVDTVIGGNEPDRCKSYGCLEALLDIEYIGAVSNPIPLTVIYSTTYSLLSWIDKVLDMEEPPLVHSVSYGNDEVEQISEEYMQSCNTQFMTAGSLGLTLLFASGDQGVWGRSGVGSTFNPDFPAASPYITAVGGTDFAVYGVIGDETVWPCSGGGFSDTFDMPEWQADQVSDYLDSAKRKGVLPDSSKFNSAGRGYPDVSALGGYINPYCVVHGDGKTAETIGTSASCPVVAGIVAQLNEVRLSAGKSSMGWINPFLYSVSSSCFRDISDGSKNNCYKNADGFTTISGWDPATGLGTPDFSCLKKHV